MMRRDSNGKPLDPLDAFPEPTDEDLFGLDEWLERGDDEDDDYYDMPNEMVLRVSDVVDGSISLQEVSERLYDYADELMGLVGFGWDLVEVMSNGEGVAIMLDGEDEDDG